MTLFNSLGSNYDFGFVLKSLFVKNKEEYKSDLIECLEKKYGEKAILVYKGREAITLALEILNFPKASQVAINGFTCFAVYRAIETAGYEAVCLDLGNKFPNRHSGESRFNRDDSRISHDDGRFWASQNDADTTENDFDLNFSAQEILKTINQNPKIKIVIIQNTLGYPCNIEKIAKICRENNIILIEDLAHSVGAIYANGKEAGTIGDFVVLSFSQDKIIDAVSGGALIVRNEKYLDRFRHSGNQSVDCRTKHPESPIGIRDAGQASMTDVNSKQQLLDRFYPLFTFIIRKTYKTGVGRTIHFLLRRANLLSKLMQESFYAKYNLPNWYSYLVMDSFNKLKKNLEHRRKIATIYSTTLNKKITSNVINKNINSSSNLRYPIFVEKRSALIEYLKREGTYVSDIWYDSVSKECKNCQMVAKRILNLPTHKNISEMSAKILSNKINQWLQSQ